MTQDPRAEWTRTPMQWEDTQTRYWLGGANERLAALRKILDAADALAAACGRGVIEGQLRDYLAARDAHLTEGTPE